MANLTITVKKSVEEQKIIAVPVYRKFDDVRLVNKIKKHLVGKLFKPADNRVFDEQVYIKIGADESMLITKKLNANTQTVIYEVERGANPEEGDLLLHIFNMTSAEISEAEFAAVRDAAAAFVNGSALADEFPTTGSPTE